MSRHEIPTHLNVEDAVLLGLSARQLATLMAGAALGYRLWLQWPTVPVPVRAGLAGACLLVGLVLALVRPGGRSLEQWGLTAMAYLAAPRRRTWAAAEPKLADWRPADFSGWVELTPDLAWAEARASGEQEASPALPLEERLA